MSSTSIASSTFARLRGEELSYISNALRTPLTSIVGFAEAILNDPALERDQKEEFVKIIKTEGERLSKFVDELLYAAIATRELPSMEHWELPTVIASSFHNVALPATTRSITLRHDVPETFPRLFLEKDFTTRMLDNILSNAVRYAPNNSEIVVHGDISGSDLILSVHAPRTTQSAENDASQLGLARTKYLAGLYGGTLQIDKPRENETIMTLCLPLGN